MVPKSLVYMLPGHAPAPAGASARTPIDLTGEDDFPDHDLPLAQRLRSASARNAPPRSRITVKDVKKPLRVLRARVTKVVFKKSKRGRSAEVQVLSSHRQLTVFKDKHFTNLNLESEHTLAMLAAEAYNVESTQTVLAQPFLELTGLRSASVSTRFPGVVEVKQPMIALQQAYMEHTQTKFDPKRLVLWTDAGGGSRSRGLAVCYRTALAQSQRWSDWVSHGYVLQGRHIDIDDAECMAILKALEIAQRLVTEGSPFEAITIYSDSMNTLDGLKNSNRRIMTDKLARYSSVLTEKGLSVSLHWVPGHSRVPGNELADRVAGKAAQRRAGIAKEVIELSDGDSEFETEGEMQDADSD